jgi:glycine cleavage system aminomethyltransferase T
MNLAYAFIEPEQAVIGRHLSVNILGEMVVAEVMTSGPYDSNYSKILA